MVQRAFVLWGLAVLLSLLFPLKLALKESGVDPLALPLSGIDLAGIGALIAVVPALLLCRHARLDERVPRWNLWLALLVPSSVLFLLLHVSWSRDLLSAYVAEAVAAAGELPLPVSPPLVMQGADLASQLLVLMCVVGVLVNLRSAAAAEDAPKRRKSK
jgi:hypothetical protein